jgi:hypothetical protein
MFLVFSKSIVIPEILEHLEDADFEDWLTATLIEKASRQFSGNPASNGAQMFPRGMADLWMLEVAQRTGRIWRGKFQVTFAKTNGEQSDGARLMEQEVGEVHFALDVRSARITFSPAAASALQGVE